MNLEQRLGALGAIGVAAAGLSQAVWWALLAATRPADASWVQGWVPLALHVGFTLTVAAAVWWQTQRAMAPLQTSLQGLRDQVMALQSTTAPALTPAPLPALERPSVPEPAPAVLGRFDFLRRLGRQLGSPDRPQAAIVVLRRDAPGGGFASAPDLLMEMLRSDAAAFGGQLSERAFALCAPGNPDELASRLRSAGPDWTVVTIDEQLRATPTAAMAALDSACETPEDDEAPPDAEAVAGALRAGRLRLGGFPLIDRKGQLLHLECPLRLQPRAGGRFEPAERWLAAATQGRLMPQVDLAAIELALQASHADGRSRGVHVASASLEAAEFVLAVQQRLEAAPEAAQLLWIEVDEVSLERLPGQLRQAATLWRRAGARVGIEHVGAAWRLLLRLQELQLDFVKLDPRFVRGLAFDERQRDWARALVGLAHDTGARAYAEGADAEDDLAALWEMGFDGATGRAVTAWHDGQARSRAADQAMSPA
ncbi:MAG: EAL domain-containing protein [Rubrivivax sp.]